MRRSNFALRLQPSLLEELRKAAELEGVALNQLINVAVAEKGSALRTEADFRERVAVPIAPKPCGFSSALEREISLWKGGRTSTGVEEEARPERGQWER